MSTKKKETSIEKKYWDRFYLENSEKTPFLIPSQFCCLLATEVGVDTAIAEFGCGNGRDSIFLARHDYNISAMDLSAEAIKQNNGKTHHYDNISFYCGDVSKENNVAMLLDNARDSSKNGNIVVYSRFFLHSLDDAQETNFMLSLSNNLIKGDSLYFESRTEGDSDIKKIYGGHFRRFLDSRQYLLKLKQQGFDVSYFIEGKGMAKYKEEDPIVARFIALKK